MAGNFVRTRSGMLIPRPPFVSKDKLEPDEPERVKVLELVEVAREAYRNAYNSLEDVRVGAAIMMEKAPNPIFTGANIRAKSVSGHMHAEEVAMTSAEMAGFMDGGIRYIASVCNHGPKMLCDKCSRAVFVIATDTGVDTKIVMSDPEMTRFWTANIRTMFELRNLPHGEIDIV